MSPVKQLRIEKGLSRRELAERVWLSERYLEAIENGTYKGSVRAMARLAKELGVSYEKLIGWDRTCGYRRLVLWRRRKNTAAPSATGCYFTIHQKAGPKYQLNA